MELNFQCCSLYCISYLNGASSVALIIAHSPHYKARSRVDWEDNMALERAKLSSPYSNTRQSHSAEQH